MKLVVAALNELLEDSLEDGTEVTVTVSRCQFKCCGGGWGIRDYGSPQTYAGRVLSINTNEFLLQVGNEVGKLAEVIADFDHLISAVAS